MSPKYIVCTKCKLKVLTPSGNSPHVVVKKGGLKKKQTNNTQDIPAISYSRIDKSG
jgi:hypothetical protein